MTEQNLENKKRKFDKLFGDTNIKNKDFVGAFLILIKQEI